jgi:hypothetical protein
LQHADEKTVEEDPTEYKLTQFANFTEREI